MVGGVAAASLAVVLLVAAEILVMGALDKGQERPVEDPTKVERLVMERVRDSDGVGAVEVDC